MMFPILSPLLRSLAPSDKTKTNVLKEKKISGVLKIETFIWSTDCFSTLFDKSINCSSNDYLLLRVTFIFICSLIKRNVKKKKRKQTSCWLGINHTKDQIWLYCSHHLFLCHSLFATCVLLYTLAIIAVPFIENIFSLKCKYGWLNNSFWFPSTPPTAPAPVLSLI